MTSLSRLGAALEVHEGHARWIDVEEGHSQGEKGLSIAVLVDMRRFDALEL